MARLVWEERYCVGVMRFDSQHKYLVTILNEFAQAFEQGREKESLMKTLYQLLLYTRTHFDAEEQLMEAHGYSEFANHKREHERMLAQVTQLLERVHGGDRPTNEAMAFLRTWLFDHILATDHRYSAFLLSKGVV